MQQYLNSFIGINSPTTMKLRGLIRKMELVVMLDSGATHNFVTSLIVHKTKLKVLTHMRIYILLGTGFEVRALSLCKTVEFSL